MRSPCYIADTVEVRARGRVLAWFRGQCQPRTARQRARALKMDLKLTKVYIAFWLEPYRGALKEVR